MELGVAPLPTTQAGKHYDSWGIGLNTEESVTLVGRSNTPSAEHCFSPAK